MIVDYYRPKDIPEVLKLLENKNIHSVLMGGGTAIDRFSNEPMAVIDLQDAGLGGINKKGNFLEIGATVSLQSLYDDMQTSDELKTVIRREATHNLRQVATVAGTLIASDGRSPFTAAMLALDAAVTLLPGDEIISLGNLLLMPEQKLASQLITKITIPLNVALAYEDVSRTPADLPIVNVSVAAWPGGRTRVIVGGFGTVPALASDGPEQGGEETAARDALIQAGDEWASAEYRMEVAPILVRRCLSKIKPKI
jgi:CO/xanthine dehydrogenase FAD-binding subunit